MELFFYSPIHQVWTEFSCRTALLRNWSGLVRWNEAWSPLYSRKTPPGQTVPRSSCESKAINVLWFASGEETEYWKCFETITLFVAVKCTKLRPKDHFRHFSKCDVYQPQKGLFDAPFDTAQVVWQSLGLVLSCSRKICFWQQSKWKKLTRDRRSVQVWIRILPDKEFCGRRCKKICNQISQKDATKIGLIRMSATCPAGDVCCCQKSWCLLQTLVDQQNLDLCPKWAAATEFWTQVINSAFSSGWTSASFVRCEISWNNRFVFLTAALEYPVVICLQSNVLFHVNISTQSHTAPRMTHSSSLPGSDFSVLVCWELQPQGRICDFGLWVQSSARVFLLILNKLDTFSVSRNEWWELQVLWMRGRLRRAFPLGPTCECR